MSRRHNQLHALRERKQSADGKHGIRVWSCNIELIGPRVEVGRMGRQETRWMGRNVGETTVMLKTAEGWGL